MKRTLPGEAWTETLQPVSGWFDVKLSELWRYRDLVLLFVRRDFVEIYKQTILGPLWYLLQPLFTTLVFTVIFGRIAGLPTDGIPQPLFYLSGIIAWQYFAGCLNKTATTFVSNAGIFGKVYFPRLCVPLSVVISNLIGFGIQTLLLLGFLLYYIAKGAVVVPQWTLIFIPLLILQMAALGLGFGIVVSSLTTKYRDLVHLVAFGVQLWMYATPVVYPASMIPAQWQPLMNLNPMAPIVGSFRYAFFGGQPVGMADILTSVMMTGAILAAGVILFSRIEKSFVDTV